jgi:hypothetical protein
MSDGQRQAATLLYGCTCLCDSPLRLGGLWPRPCCNSASPEAPLAPIAAVRGNNTRSAWLQGHLIDRELTGYGPHLRPALLLL